MAGSREEEAARMAVVIANNTAATNMAAPKMATASTEAAPMAAASKTGTSAAHLSPEEEAATHRFLENVNKWRAANNLAQVQTFCL
jgi:hypothetical protein